MSIHIGFVSGSQARGSQLEKMRAVLKETGGLVSERGSPQVTWGVTKRTPVIKTWSWILA